MEPLRTTLPTYDGGGLLNLVSSLQASLGGPRSQAAPLADLDLVSLCANKHVVLFVIDGLGYHFLKRARAPALNRTLHQSLSSVFPSTTASAITTFFTGLSPREHGNIGWNIYDNRLEDVVSPLPFVRRSTGQSLTAEGIEPHTFFDYQALTAELDVTSYSVSPQAIAFSEFNRYHAGGGEIRPYATLRTMFSAVAQILEQTQKRSFIYAYYPEIDGLGHLHGMGSEQVEACLTALDRGFERFLHEVTGTDTVVLVTADHGFVDPPTDKRLHLPDFPEVKGLLTQLLCGEPRTAFCHVSPGAEDKFAAVVEGSFADCLDLVPSAEIIQRGYFGPGTDHPQLTSRVGDFTLLMREDYMLTDALAGEQRVILKGVHGGLSKSEMRVPLCVVEV